MFNLLPQCRFDKVAVATLSAPPQTKGRLFVGVVFGGGVVGRVGREGLFCGVETRGDDGGGEGSRKWSITV